MQTYIKLAFVSIIILLTFSDRINQDPFIVVLDAGHGGKDPGRPTKNGYKEKDIALKVVLAIGKELEKNTNIKVVYTRKTDKFIELKERGRIANKANADLFVSVHCNAHSSQAYGSETYVLGLHRNKTNFEVAKAENEVIFLEDDYEVNYDGFDPNSPEAAIGLTLAQEDYLDQSILLASFIQNEFKSKLKRKDRGVKQAGFVVLHQTVMPSVLVETGFITNKKEGAYLNSKKGQAQLAKSVAKAIVEYKKSLYQLDESVYLEDDIIADQDTTASEKIYDGITFKVQIAAGKKAIAPKSYNFKGLTDITRYKKGKFYKYYYGATSNFDLINQMLEQAKDKGYNSSFIVAFKNGKIIPLSEL